MSYYKNSNLYFNEKGKISQISTNKTLFTAVNIGTPAKGPLYTLVDGVGKQINSLFKYANIRMNYMYEDTPIDDAMYFETIVNSSNPYSFYPLIKQILGINNFIQTQSSDSHSILLDKILLYSKYGDCETICGNKIDKAIRKTSEKFELMTSVSKIVKDKPYIMMNQKAYSITDEFSYSYGEALVALPDIESLYLIELYTLRKLLCVSNVVIELEYSKRIRKLSARDKNSFSLVDTIASKELEKMKSEYYEYYSDFYASNIDEILRLCIYIPQIILIEKALHDVDVTMSITVEINGKFVSMTITNNEYIPDICLLNIIMKLISVL